MNRTARPLRIAVFAAAATLLGITAACSSGAGSLGTDCLRDDDCAAGVCFALKCRLAPTDPNARAAGGANAYTPPVVDAGSPAPQDAGTPEPTPDAEAPAAGDAG